jgi:GGDEF domain-containing protein
MRSIRDNGKGMDLAQRTLVERALAVAAEAEQRLAEQSRRIAVLEMLTLTDEITGLLNRRGFNREMRRILADAKRYDERGILCFIDLDDFKTINDVFGHMAGDRVLNTIGRLLQLQVRENDVVARLGGDEFALVLAKCDQEDGMRRARERAAGRDDLIELGVQDLADVMAELKRLPECNGRIAVVGLCYGGPFALLGPARLGCDAGLSLHGTAVENHLHELANIGAAPIRLHWGDADRVCPPDTLARIRAATDGMANVEITIYPGVVHGYTAASNAKSWNAAAAEDSWAGALAVLDGLRDAPQAAAQA